MSNNPVSADPRLDRTVADYRLLLKAGDALGIEAKLHDRYAERDDESGHVYAPVELYVRNVDLTDGESLAERLEDFAKLIRGRLLHQENARQTRLAAHCRAMGGVDG